MFRKLCGTDALTCVVFVGTKSDKLSPQEKQNIESEWRDEWLKEAIADGARLQMHDNTHDSAASIIRQLLPNIPVGLKLQKELVGEKKPLESTEAGEEVSGNMVKRVDELITRCAELEKVNEQVTNEKEKREIEVENEKLKRELAEIRADQQLLKRDAKQKEEFRAELATAMKATPQDPLYSRLVSSTLAAVLRSFAK
jgi:hypothetical protein